ncbi:MAG TPA: type II toxin-antitoxin system RelE/ParE family toxin [Candidatus Acidoferrales bacterium]|nr:type II toxin-antitoxin system RelE/ParE family toxin [Candidatus Acidoferrales bacterium]
MPRYTVLVHPRVQDFLTELKDEKLKERMKQSIRKLAEYPLSLKELDVEKLQGVQRTFRVRIGRYRFIFFVDKKERTILVTHLGKRESIYEK